MKKFIYTLALIISTATVSIAGDGSTDSSGVDDQFKRDVQVSLTGKYIQDMVYFNLRMLNESKDGFYSMVKEYANGEFVSVDVRQMIANTINSPLLYSFSDEEVPLEDVTYILYRISDNTVEVDRWVYCAHEKKLCDADPLVASNE